MDPYLSKFYSIPGAATVWSQTRPEYTPATTVASEDKPGEYEIVKRGIRLVIRGPEVGAALEVVEFGNLPKSMIDSISNCAVAWLSPATEPGVLAADRKTQTNCSWLANLGSFVIKFKGVEGWHAAVFESHAVERINRILAKHAARHSLKLKEFSLGN